MLLASTAVLLIGQSANAQDEECVTHKNDSNMEIITNKDVCVNFIDDSTAGNATISNKDHGAAVFSDDSTAGNATISNQSGGHTKFRGDSTAGNATISNQSEGFTAFAIDSTAGNAVITNQSGGGTLFDDDSSGKNAAVINNTGGYVDVAGVAIYGKDSAVDIGSLSGGGDVYLGQTELVLGNLDKNDEISGNISGRPSKFWDNELEHWKNELDDTMLGPDGILTPGGTLTKVGKGILKLGGNNTYTDGTRLKDGYVEVSRNVNLGAASGVLIFDGGTLRTLSGFTMDRATTLGAGGGTFETALESELVQNGKIGGVGDLTVTGSGMLTLGGANDYTGNTLVKEGTLSAGAINTFSDASAHAVDAGARLMLNGFDQTIASLDNAGSVALGGAAPGTVLAISGDYIGRGGTIVLNTELGGDNSATDRVVISGNASGVGQVQVNNAGGLGAPTVEGIKIIDIAGTSAAALSLSSDYITADGQKAVVAGPYAYTLHRNGVANPDDGDWYLRSQLQSDVVVGPDSVDPATPRYSPGVGVYEVYPQVLLGLTRLPPLQQRLGNRQGTENTPVWLRIEGTHDHINAAATTSGAGYDADSRTVQGGLDGLLYENAGGQLIGGLTAHYGVTTASVDTLQEDGRLAVHGYGFGGTLTWYGTSGFYLDAQGTVSWYSSDLLADVQGISGPLVSGNAGFGYALSLEAGQKVALGGGWAVTPQAQLTLSSVAFDRFSDLFGTDVRLDGAESLRGRFGVALGHEQVWTDDDGTLSRSNVYGLANLSYQFTDLAEVDVAGVKFGNAAERLWGGLVVGGSYAWNDDRVSLYGEARLNTSLSSFANSYTVGGAIGLKAKF